MDFHGNNVHHVGYGHPRLIEAIRRQLDELSFAPRRYTCEPAVELAEKLVEIAPGNLSKVLFAPSGSDAVEMAPGLRPRRDRPVQDDLVLGLVPWRGFRGAAWGARPCSGAGPIGPLLAGTEHVPPFGDYRNAWGVTEGSADLCAKTIRYVLEKEGDVAAVIAEPVRAVPYVPPAGFWPRSDKPVTTSAPS